MTETEIALAQSRCKHFNGTRHDTCLAGVAYELLKPGLPCILSLDKSGQGCPKREFPTREEAIAKHEAEEKSMQELMDRMLAVTPMVNECRKLAGLTKGGMYQRPCEACKTGTLHIDIASNGHARVRCSSQLCVNWIE